MPYAARIPDPALDARCLVAFARRAFAAPDDAQLTVRPLRGGLEAVAVARVQVRFSDGRGHPRSHVFVAKRLDGGQRREAGVYRALQTGPAAPAAPFWPRLLGEEPAGPEATHLFLEHVAVPRRWPWADPAAAGSVLEQLARLHAAPPGAAAGALPDWDYETELTASAVSTLDAAERHATATGHDDVRGALPALRRFALALPAARRQLLRAGPFGTAVVHGDAHPGNVLLRRRGAATEAVLLDWGRARLGSPLEDVSSWLESLGFREAEARRRHDTLLRRYLIARGLARHLDRGLRDAYWLAAAGNVLAGALRFHLAVARGWRGAGARERAGAVRAALDDLRVVRRADAVWRS